MGATQHAPSGKGLLCVKDVSIMNSNTLQQTLHDVARKQRRTSLIALGLQLAWIGLVSIATIIFLDTVTPLSPLARAAFSTGLLIGLMVLLYRQYTPKQAPERAALHYARRLESHYGYNDNLLVNAVCLTGQAGVVAGTLSGALARRCVDRATRVIDSLATDDVVDRLPTRQHAYRCVIFVTVFILALAAFPNVVSRGMARLVFPFADYPPYSPTRFAVAIDPNPVPFSGDAMVTATLTGRVPDTAFLVQIDNGDIVNRSSMQPTGPSQFTRRLIALREPMTIRIETDTGYSRRYHISLVKSSEDRQAVTSNELARESDIPNPDGTNRVNPAVHIARSAIDELTQTAHRIDDHADDLADELGRIESRLLTDEQWADRIKRLMSRLDQFSQRNGSLIEQLRNALANEESSISDLQNASRSLNTLTDRLGQLALPHVANSTNFSVSKDRVAIRQWLQSVRMAATGDLRMLADIASRLNGRTASTAEQGSEADEGRMVSGEGVNAAPSATTTGARTGDYQETLDVASLTPALTDALVEQAPQAYRDLVAQYFARLIRDQTAVPTAIYNNAQQDEKR